MNLLILGLGNVGKELARQWKERGHTVVGTTTTPEKVQELSGLVDRVELLRGSETAKVQAAGRDCDAVVVSVAPSFRGATTPEQREMTYRETLVDSCTSAAATVERVVFLSSFSVYGDGGSAEEPVDERTPVATSDEPSARYYQMAEQAVLASKRGTVLRLPDIYGAPGDYSYLERVRLAHQYMGGRVPFGADAPLYRIHCDDVVRAIVHVLDHELTGTFNVCDNDGVPPTNREVFDALADQAGVDRLTFLNQVRMPNRKVSADKFYATGYRLQHSQQPFV